MCEVIVSAKDPVCKMKVDEKQRNIRKFSDMAATVILVAVFRIQNYFLLLRRCQDV